MIFAKKEPSAACTRSKRRTIELDPSDEKKVGIYKSGACDYVRKLLPDSREFLYTKPFYAVADAPQVAPVSCFHDLANIILALNLPGKSRILDVACGPGWLSEYLYRYGYDVTGIDVCEDLLAIANDRARSIARRPRGRDGSCIRFHRADIERESLDEQFDAIIMYDCLHHLIDVDAAFNNILKMLAPGGKVLIKEGAMPPAGCEDEKNMLAESEQYHTFESPFEHEYLTEYLKGRGFCSVKSYIEINGFFEKSEAVQAGIDARFSSPYNVNILICQVEEVLTPERIDQAVWSAQISAESVKEVSKGGSKDLEMVLRIKNLGSTCWRGSPSLLPGSLSLGIRVYGGSNEPMDEHLCRMPIPKVVRPGEEIVLDVFYPISSLGFSGEYTLVADMVLQGHFWFGDKGSTPFIRKHQI